MDTSQTDLCAQKYGDTTSILYKACKYSSSRQVKNLFGLIRRWAQNPLDHHRCKSWVMRKELSGAGLVNHYAGTNEAVNAAIYHQCHVGFRNGHKTLICNACDPAKEPSRKICRPPELETEGFVNLLKTNYPKMSSPCDAPPGAVIIYKTSFNPYGHIEIRKEGPGCSFGSDFTNTNSFTHKSMSESIRGLGTKTVIGVFIKPDAV